MAGAHSRHRCPLRREDPLIIIAFQSGRVVFHPGEDNGWKKWKSKRERRRRRVGWEKGGEEGKEKKSMLLGSGGGNSNWNRERDLSSARDVSREPSSFVEQKVHRYRGICISTEMRKYVGAVGAETLFPWLFPCRKSLREEEEKELNIFFLIHRNSLLIPIRAIFSVD